MTAEGGAAGSGEASQAPALEKRLVALMAARLVLSLLSLAIGVVLDAAGDDLALVNRVGFYATVVLAFLATGVYGQILRRIQRPKPFAALNIATDITFVTAMVHFSGGASSVFTFFYVLVTLYGAVLFERRGALVSAGVGALAYGAVLVAAQPHLLGGVTHPGESLWVPFTQWAAHASAMLLVAGLASFLATELRQADAALRQRTSDLERLRRLHERTVQSLMSGLLTVDLAGNITTFNPEAERITGASAAEALGRDVNQVLPEIRERVIDREETAASGTRTRMPFRGPGGDELHLGAAAYVLRETDGSPTGHVVIFQDVTDVVEMENDLRRSERLAAAGELSASIAHEIRNPLAAISGSIQLLGDRLGPSSDESERLMQIVLRETDRLNHLITDFLLYARPGPLHLEEVAIAPVVEEIVEMFDAVRAPGVHVDLGIEPGVAVRADAVRLRQVLWNLILNAAQAMPEGGTLGISARRHVPTSQGGETEGRNREQAKSGWVEISVVDEGVGIPADVRERIFDPFFTTRCDGSGLGLATVHRVVEDHDGVIRLESREGQGTVVRLRLRQAEVQ